VQQYILRRIVLMVPTLFGLTLLVFVMVRLYPGDVLALVVGDNYAATDDATRQAIMEQYRLDKNVAQQYVIWMSELLRFDLGHSLRSGRDVKEELGQRIPVSMQLGAMALTFSVGMGVPIGVISALKRNSWADYVGRSFAVGMLSAPSFWVALILIGLAGRYFTWAVPSPTYVHFFENPVSNVKFMIVPAFILGASSSGGIMRFTRTAMLEVLRQDYIRTAHAKGLHEQAVIYRHALKNALIPVITVIGLALPGLIGGSVIMETVYSIPGMGRYYITAINQLDFPVVQAINLCTALVVLFSNLGVDVAYSWVDPRIRYS
jgi:peptide/nickel transport system permease protein